MIGGQASGDVQRCELVITNSKEGTKSGRFVGHIPFASAVDPEKPVSVFLFWSNISASFGESVVVHQTTAEILELLARPQNSYPVLNTSSSGSGRTVLKRTTFVA